MSYRSYTPRRSGDMELFKCAHEDMWELRLRIGGKFECFHVLSSHMLLMYPNAQEAAQAAFEDLTARVQAITGQPIREVYDWLMKVGATTSIANIIVDHYRAPLIRLKKLPDEPPQAPVSTGTTMDLPQARIIGTVMEELFDTLFGVTK